MTQVRCEAIGRFEWERLVRRIVVPKERRAAKLVALMMATYANADGTNVRPGEPLLADVCQLGRSTVRECLKWLRQDACLIWRHSHGSNVKGIKRADEYQLCVPSDWETRFVLLSENGRDDDLAIPRPRRNNPNPLGTRRFDIDTDRQTSRQPLADR